MPVITKTFNVTGIACAGCATDIEAVLGQTDGVAKTTVNYSTGAVAVEFDPEEISEQQVADVLKRLGLNVHVVI